MFTISKEIQFDAGHRVPAHKSKCFNPHGHRYRVVAHLSGDVVTEPGAPDEGMLMDFSELKNILTEMVHDYLDHGFIVYKDDQPMLQCFDGCDDWKIIIFPYIPTAENLAKWIWDTIKPSIDDHFRGNLKLERIEVYETPTSLACYSV